MASVDKAIELLEREHFSGPKPEMHDTRFRKIGLTDACRQIVNSEWMSPVEIRDRMMSGGFKNGDKSKLLSSVFATLKRLAIKEIEGRKVDGKMKYRKRQTSQIESEEAA